MRTHTHTHTHRHYIHTLLVIQHKNVYCSTCNSATAEHSFLYRSHCAQCCGRFLSWSICSAVALASSTVSVLHHLWAFQSKCCAVKCLNRTHMHSTTHITDKLMIRTHPFCRSIYITYLDRSMSFSRFVSSPSNLREECKRHEQMPQAAAMTQDIQAMH